MPQFVVGIKVSPVLRPVSFLCASLTRANLLWKLGMNYICIFPYHSDCSLCAEKNWRGFDGLNSNVQFSIRWVSWFGIIGECWRVRGITRMFALIMKEVLIEGCASTRFCKDIRMNLDVWAFFNETFVLGFTSKDEAIKRNWYYYDRCKNYYHWWWILMFHPHSGN